MQRICAGSVSTHALREEGDRSGVWCRPRCRYFNPRPPRGGRLQDFIPARRSEDFNPRPPRGGRLTGLGAALIAVVISIHALREEGDLWITYSTNASADISIHALREEGDHCQNSRTGHGQHFNPRPPRGGRRGFGDDAFAYWAFQSTLSVGRATKGAQHTVIGLVLFQSTPSARRATWS